MADIIENICVEIKGPRARDFVLFCISNNLYPLDKMTMMGSEYYRACHSIKHKGIIIAYLKEQGEQVEELRF